jgi:hypothetical protein
MVRSAFCAPDGRRHHDAEFYDGDNDVDGGAAGEGSGSEMAAGAQGGGGGSGAAAGPAPYSVPPPPVPSFAPLLPQEEADAAFEDGSAPAALPSGDAVAVAAPPPPPEDAEMP